MLEMTAKSRQYSHPVPMLFLPPPSRSFSEAVAIARAHFWSLWRDHTQVCVARSLSTGNIVLVCVTREQGRGRFETVKTFYTARP